MISIKLYWNQFYAPSDLIQCFVEVVYFHISDSVINDELHIDPNSLDALGRLAGSGGYTRILDNFVMQRFHPPGSSPPEDIFEDAKAAAKLDRKLKI